MSEADEFATSGTFVAHDDAGRLFIALAEISLEHGYETVTAGQIARGAGLARADFDRLFASRDACFSAAYRTAVRQGFSHATRAFDQMRGGWPHGIHAGLGALLTYAAGTPAFAHLCVTEKLRHLDAIEGTREEALELLGQFLAPALREASTELPAAEILVELIGGGIFDVIQTHVLEDRLAELPAALPAITTYTLSPFVGHEDALRIAEES